MFKLKIVVIALFVLSIAAFSTLTGDRRVKAESPAAPMQAVTYLEQGWTGEDRQVFYHTTQGTRIVPYQWFMALEQPLSQQPFLTDAMVEEYRLIPDPDSTNNPDRLPVGLVKDSTADGDFISVTCAACHTAQITFNGAKLRIDGGPAMHNLNGFFTKMFEALLATEANPVPAKFTRFARKVLGERYNLIRRERLKLEVAREIAKSAATILKARRRHLYPTEEGFGRLDALGRGGNLVLGGDLDDDDNLVVANAPVSFPHLWGTSFFDWVQWNGSIQQPMARNIAEALGVNTPVTLKGDPAKLFESAVNIQNLALLEKKLEKLTPPRWPEAVLGTIDTVKASRGATLYAQHCAACHDSKPAPPNEFGKVFLEINMYPLEVIGTDQNAAVNFNQRTARTGELSRPPNNLPPVVPAVGALKIVVEKVAQRKYAELQIPLDQQNEMNGFRPNRMRAPRAYRARNMDGIWATAPYLHNNSVSSLYQLLLPAAQRETSFYVGNLEYDPRVVGFRTERFAGGFQLRTNITGNSNAGHEFRDGPRQNGVIGPLLSDEERFAIIEFLKTK
jgi:hypothetical protein